MPKPLRASRTQVKSKAEKTTSATLPSASLPRPHLVEVGARYRGQALIDHAHAVTPKLHAHPRFATFGFDGAWTSAIEALITQIETAALAKQSIREDAAPTSESLKAAIDAAKEWRRDAATIVSIVPKLAAKAPSLSTGSSVDGLVKSIEKVLPLVGHKDAAKVGGGPGKKKEGEALLAILKKTQAAHRAVVGKLSPEVRATNEKQGILYEELRRLGRAARRVCPEESHLFTVSTHARARMPSRARAKPAAPAASAPAATG